MTLQFTWQGCDSLLAAPLVLDLVRFVELSQRRGEVGVLSHLGQLFQTPAGTRGTRFFPAIFATLRLGRAACERVAARSRLIATAAIDRCESAIADSRIALDRRLHRAIQFSLFALVRFFSDSP